VHGREVVESLLASHVHDPSAFEWLRQMRTYMDERGQLLLASMHTAVAHAYEYVGAAPRLVVTPLTERCVACLGERNIPKPKTEFSEI
jgi:dynein heavy chain